MRNFPPLSCLRAVVLWVSALASCTAAFARIGDTEAELTKRLGEPVLRATDTLVAEGKFLRPWPKLTYRQNDWRITCDIVDGRCARADYSKPGEWTEEHFLAVLNANAQGATWSDRSDAKFEQLKREWKRSDGATAIWQKPTGLTITAPAYLRAKETAEAKAKAQSRQVPKL